MDMEFTTIIMEIFMMENGKMIKKKEMESTFTILKMRNMKVTLSKVRDLVKERIYMQMVISISENGRKISKMDKVKYNILLDRPLLGNG